MTRRNFIAKLAAASALLVSPLRLLAGATTADKFSSIATKASKQKWYDMEMGDLVTRVSLELLDTPYIAGTLDENPAMEQAVVNLVGLDCVTFFENSLCIARCIKKQNYRYTDLIDEVTFTRYRAGKLDGYVSRLHYTSDWISDNVAKNVIVDVTESLGGQPHQFSLDYMTDNASSYPALKQNPSIVPQIKEIELALSEKTFYLLKPADIASAKIIDGDIIALATSQEGLDYAHTGLAFNKNLLHASSKLGKVVVDKSITSYVKANKKLVGISVLRANAVY